MAKRKVDIKVKKTWLYYALKPIWFMQTALGSNNYFLIDKAFSYEVVK